MFPMLNLEKSEISRTKNKNVTIEHDSITLKYKKNIKRLHRILTRTEKATIKQNIKKKIQIVHYP
tara:strand:+ start:233 stop:427 length:195 start_codon:yes stop_codon:yes gene_type:complete